MGLDRGDLEKIPQTLSVAQAYARMRKWYSSRFPTAERLSEDYRRRATALAKKLPAKPPDPDMAYVCLNVISNLLEWAYHQEDEHGIKMAAYAHYIADKKFGGFGNLGAVAEQSSLKRKLESTTS